MSRPPVALAKRVAGEVRWLASVAHRILQVSQAINKAAATIEKQGEEIEALKRDVQDLRTENTLQAARLESIATRAAADVTGDLSRRLGFLEGRASRD